MKQVFSVVAAGFLTVATGGGLCHAQSLYDASAIDSIEFEVFDGPDGALLASATAAWSMGLWIVDGVPTGEGRLVRATTFDTAGRRTYWGEVSGVTVEANFPFGDGGALIFMAVPEGIYVLIPPFTPVGVMVLYPFSIEVAIDIEPGSVENPFNVRSAGVTPVVVLGGPDTDVTALVASTLRLAGVAAVRSKVTDVCTLNVEASAEALSSEGPDGTDDLLLHFESADLAAALGDAADGEFVPLVLTGETEDGVHVEGLDGVTVIRPPVKAGGRRR